MAESPYSEIRQTTDVELNARASELVDARKYDQAEKLYRRNVSYQTARYQADPSECEFQALNDSRQKLAGVLLAQDAYPEAEKLLHQS